MLKATGFKSKRSPLLNQRTGIHMTDPIYNYDVLIVGGGNAACCAAHAALEKTKSVAIIEKSTKRDRGGNL